MTSLAAADRSRADFKEALLQIMEQKNHWAWPLFTSGQVDPKRLHLHLEQEYATYVRDFPVLVARAYVQCPVAEVRRELVENIYEEETGGLVAGKPHPELFLDYPRGLNMDLERFSHVTLLDGSAEYRRRLDHWTTNQGWECAAAVTTLFIEGTAFERGELDDKAPKRPLPKPEDHPLVKHYGLPLTHLRLAKAHGSVEGEHRQAAWRVLLDHVKEDTRSRVVEAMRDVAAGWQLYRDSVAAAVGLKRT